MNAPAALAEGLPRRRFSVADVMRMVEVGLIGEDERLEVLDGEIVPMSPKGSRHEAIKAALNLRWGRMRPDTHAFAPETGLRLSDRTYLEPDFIVYSASILLADLRGSDVLLAVEVADSSLDYDLRRKPAIFAAFGVRELWVIDAARRLTHVHRRPVADGFELIEARPADARLAPEHAPAEFGFALDDLRA
jgi:Uma2 family endonuclease